MSLDEAVEIMTALHASTSHCSATFNVEHGFTDAFEGAWGFPFAGTGKGGDNAKAWVNDVVTLFRALNIVENNAADAIGGGGVPLQPSPPVFCTSMRGLTR